MLKSSQAGVYALNLGSMLESALSLNLVSLASKNDSVFNGVYSRQEDLNRG